MTAIDPRPYDERQLAVVLVQCGRCRRWVYATDPQPWCIPCRRWGQA